MKKAAILQSNYIPWKGYFDLIAAVDEFIFYDTMQYTRRDWRNRNQIKTPHGKQWLTIPVITKGKYYQKICQTKIEPSDWKKSHWKALECNYKKAPFFEEISSWLHPLYHNNQEEYLSSLNYTFIKAICSYLQIPTKLSHSQDFQLLEGKTERLADLCQQVGATEYISGPAAKDYLQKEVFEQYKIKLSWFDYSGYPDYPQLWGPFEHGVTILDLLFHCGPNTPQFMKHLH
jgi:hypothetical protein